MTEKEFEDISTGIRSDLVTLARRFCRATGSPDEGEDIVQEALIALWNLSESGYPIRSAKALAIKITKNICVSRYRKRKIVPLPITGDSILGGEPADSSTERADNEKIKEELYGQLTRTEREFITLRHEEGLSLDEIASATGRPKSSIKVTISNAKKRMRERIKEWL